MILPEVDRESRRRVAELLQSSEKAHYEQGQELLLASGWKVSDLRDVWGGAPVGHYLTDQEVRVWVYLHLKRNLRTLDFAYPGRDYESFYASLHSWAYGSPLDSMNVPAEEWARTLEFRRDSFPATSGVPVLLDEIRDRNAATIRKMAGLFGDSYIAWDILEDPASALPEVAQRQLFQIQDLYAEAPTDEVALAYAEAFSVLSQDRTHFWGTGIHKGLPWKLWKGDRYRLLVDLKRELRV